MKNKKDILFIVPNFIHKDGAIWKSIQYRFHSPGVLCLASFINNSGFKAEIFDCNLENIHENDFESELLKRYKYESYTYIGFSATTQTVKSALNLSSIVKKFWPNSKIIFGGAHPTVMPDDVIKEVNVDAVIIGEGEHTLLELLKNDNLSEIAGLYYKNLNSEIIKNPSRQRLRNIDAFGLPDYNLVPLHLSKPLIGTYKKLPATIMVTSRGCPGLCNFCSRVIKGKVSFFSPERIFKEMTVLKNEYGIKHIIFFDDTFIADEKRIVDLCKLIINNKLKISWTCSSRADNIAESTLKLMKDAGCYQIMYGIESFDENVLKNINKNIDIKQTEKTITLTKKHNILARIAIMIGNKGDTKTVLENNIKKIKSLRPDLLQVAITTPLPGSQLFEEYKKNNLIYTYDWDKYDGSKPLFKHDILSDEQIQYYYRKTYMSFYLRPSFIISQLLKIESYSRFVILLKGFISFLNLLLKKKSS